jgi:hypothetical protein
MAILNNSNAISSGGYDINNSLRFRASASATLTRTFGSTYTDKTKSTFSVWLKRGILNDGNGQAFLYYNSSGSGGSFGFAGANSGGTLINDCIAIGNRNATTGSGDYSLQTTALYRDPSAWYHIVIVFDTGQATASNRLKLYVNGSQVTDFVATQYPTLNYQSTALIGGNAVAHQIGFNANTGAPNYSDLYLTEINFIDGQALTPSSFGSTNATTGVWQPAKYTGTYGTNGFYLNFTDIALTSGSNAGLGKDFSGNANYWNTNNISVTAGVTYDAMIDSPTLTSATVANYAVLNPLNVDTATLSNANLTSAITGSAGGSSYFGTMALPPSSKIYAEINLTSVGDATSLGITSNTSTTSNARTASISYAYDGNKCVLGTDSAFGATYTANDIIGIAIDTGAGTAEFFKNNASQGTITNSAISSNTMFFTCVYFSSNTGLTATHNWNFGQRPFSYTPPTGFVRLNTYNLPDSTIKKGNTVMDATLWTGTGGARTITNAAGFRPDWVWVKRRSSADDHYSYDSVRGANLNLVENSTVAEANVTGYGGGGIGAATSTGFTIVAGTSNADNLNGSGITFVGWQWQAGQGSTSSNTSGSITSTVSVNATAGFSIATYTGNGTSGATVGHGLGVAPKFIIVKTRSNIDNWPVGTAALGWDRHTLLNLNSATAVTSSTWNDTAPTSTVFSIGSDSRVNNSGWTYVAYCWAEIAGFSKFGSYTGNGSADGPFVYLGFRPEFVMWKRTNAVENWYIEDTSRSPFNVADDVLSPNLANAESVSSSRNIDFLSNGFKQRTSDSSNNGSGDTYIYMAFAENPFKNANAR